MLPLLLKGLNGEREYVFRWMISLGFSSGHPPYTESMAPFL